MGFLLGITMSLDLETIGIAMETSGLEKGTAALKSNEQAAHKAADAADKFTKSSSMMSNGQKAAADAAEKVRQSIDKQVAAMRLQADTFGLSARQAALFKLQLDGATDAQLKQANAALKSVESLKAGRDLGESIGRSVRVGALAIVAGATAAYYSLEKLIGSVAKYQDLAEQTGGDPAGLASLRTAADVGGTSVESLVTAANRMQRSLSKVDDESKGVGKALAAIGISVQQFKNLRADEQIRLVAQSLNQYEDGAGKVAVIQAIMGRGAANLLPALKELGSETAANNRLTNEQIKLADDYKDAQARARSELLQMAESMAAAAVPALAGLANAVREVIEKMFGAGEGATDLEKNKAIENWARSGAEMVAFFADALMALVRVGKVVSTSLQSVFADVKLIGAVSGNAGPLGTGLLFKENRDNIAAALAERNATVAKSNRALDALLKTDAASFRNTLKNNFAKQDADRAAASLKAFRDSEIGRKSTGGGRKLDFDDSPASKGGSGRSKNQFAEAERYLESLQRQLDKTRDLSVEETTLAEIQSGRMGRVNPALEKQLLNTSRLIDLQRAEKDNLKASERAAKDAADAARNTFEEAAKYAQMVETPFEKLQRQLSELERVASNNPLIGVETASRMGTKYWQEYLKSLESVNKEINQFDEFSKKAAENIQDSIGNGLYDIMQGNFKNIGNSFKQMLDRMVAEAIAADISRKLFGGLVQGGSGGGLLGSAVSAIGGLLGGGGGSYNMWGGATGAQNSAIYSAIIGSAKGNVFNSPGLSAYSGQIVSSPTLFPFAKGVGLMGEAGPEAIMPLKRGADGKLGVSSGGGQPFVVNNTFNVPANVTHDTKQQIAAMAGDSVRRAQRNR